MKDIKPKIIFYILTVVIFYLFPKLIIDTGSGMLILLIIIPASLFVVSAAYCVKNGFSLIFTIAAEILFINTIYIYYNESAWIYASVYGAINLLGQGIGAVIKKMMKK